MRDAPEILLPPQDETMTLGERVLALYQHGSELQNELTFIPRTFKEIMDYYAETVDLNAITDPTSAASAYASELLESLVTIHSESLRRKTVENELHLSKRLMKTLGTTLAGRTACFGNIDSETGAVDFHPYMRAVQVPHTGLGVITATSFEHYPESFHVRQPGPGLLNNYVVYPIGRASKGQLPVQPPLQVTLDIV